MLNETFFGAAPSSGPVTDGSSLRFNSPDSSCLSKTFSAGNRRTWSCSFWIKRSNLTAGDYVHIFGTYVTDYTILVFATGNDTLQFWTNLNVTPVLETNAVLRDPSAWYHVLLTVDTTQANATDRAHIYINGIEASYALDNRASQLTQNLETNLNTAAVHEIGGNPSANPTRYLDGYLADVHFIDGQALAPTDFGEFDANNGVWQQKAYSGGTYGTNGFHLDFSNPDNIGNDAAGSNNWTPVNLLPEDVTSDSPTNNFCTWNPLYPYGCSTYSNGNLDCVTNQPGYGNTLSTFGLASGKWYCELDYTSVAGSAAYCQFGITARLNNNASEYIGAYPDGWGFSQHIAGYYHNASSVGYGSTWGAGDTVALALDKDNDRLYLAINGVWQNGADPVAGTGGVDISSISGKTTWIGVGDLGGDAVTGSINFGQREFTHSAPAGYNTICSANLPDPTIADGSTAMDVVTYDGDGTNNRDIVVNHSTDFVWIKARNQIDGHSLYDIVRGPNKTLKLPNSLPEFDESATHGPSLSAFNSDGFTIGANANAAQVNQPGFSMVAWSWDAGDTTVSNTDGTITSSVRANPSAGFSIISYTGNGVAGATVGHGLNEVPGLLIVKNRSNATTIEWGVKHSGLYSNPGNWLSLSTSGVATAESAGVGSLFNATNPTSSVFTIGPRPTTNTSGDNYIAYCWAPVEGYSAFGSFTGSTDLPFVYCGFKPRFILIKNAGIANFWRILDTERSPYNVTDDFLSSDTSQTETAVNSQVDVLSNGFKLRTADDINNPASPIIWAAFASHPFKNARAH